MDATCTIQDSIHVFNLVHKYVSRILGTYQKGGSVYINSNNTGIVSRNRSTPTAPAASFDIYTIMEKCDENMEHK